MKKSKSGLKFLFLALVFYTAGTALAAMFDGPMRVVFASLSALSVGIFLYELFSHLKTRVTSVHNEPGDAAFDMIYEDTELDPLQRAYPELIANPGMHR